MSAGQVSALTQILVSLTVLQEVFHRHGRWTAVAHSGFSNAEFREHMVPESSMSSPPSHHDHLILSGELLVVTVDIILNHQCALVRSREDHIRFHSNFRFTARCRATRKGM